MGASFSRRKGREGGEKRQIEKLRAKLGIPELDETRARNLLNSKSSKEFIEAENKAENKAYTGARNNTLNHPGKPSAPERTKRARDTYETYCLNQNFRQVPRRPPP